MLQLFAPTVRSDFLFAMCPPVCSRKQMENPASQPPKLRPWFWEELALVHPTAKHSSICLNLAGSNGSVPQIKAI